MFGKTFIAASIMTMSMLSIAAAQSPTKLDQFDYWGAYSYKANNSRVCYALTSPTVKNPASVNHGDNFFLISKRPGGAGNFEPQFMAGYELRENSSVTVNIDGKKDFKLFTKGTSAWVESAEGEKALVAAMRNGKTMTVKAVSKRGTNTSYAYSLKGVSAALSAAQKCK